VPVARCGCKKTLIRMRYSPHLHFQQAK
jgi:hypothetical protein